MLIGHPKLAVDACCLINLDVSGRLLEVIQALPVPVVVSDVVWEQEVPTLRRVAQDQRAEAVPGAESAVKTGLIEVVGFRGPEADAFVKFAAELRDDGESATCAIAFSRGWGIATDDRAAIRFVDRRCRETQLVTTPELVKHWVDSNLPPPADVREMIGRIHQVGRYFPPRAHPLWEWWERVLR